MFNFESWIFCQFSSNTGFFLVEGLFTPQKLESEKIKLQISILEGIKLKKHEEGVFHWRNRSQNFRFSKCYDICFYNFCEKHLLMGKMLLKSQKNVFQISHLIFWKLQAAKYLIYGYFYFLIILLFCLNFIAPIALKP